MDNSELFEHYEDELHKLISKMIKSGIKPSVVMSILTDILKGLKMETYCAEWLKEFNKNGS